MLSKQKWTTIIGDGPIASAVAKVWGLFIDIEHIEIPVLDNCSDLSDITYKKLIRNAQVVTLIPNPFTKANYIINWIDRLRSEIVLTKGILIFMQDKYRIERLKNTSLYFETGVVNYPLGADDGSRIIQTSAPLSTLLTVRNDLAKVFVGFATWAVRKAQGGLICKAELIAKEIETPDLGIKRISRLRELKSILLGQEIQSLLISLSNHNLSIKKRVEHSCMELETYSLETEEDIFRMLNASKAIMEILRWKS